MVAGQDRGEVEWRGQGKAGQGGDYPFPSLGGFWLGLMVVPLHASKLPWERENERRGVGGRGERE